MNDAVLVVNSSAYSTDMELIYPVLRRKTDSSEKLEHLLAINGSEKLNIYLQDIENLLAVDSFDKTLTANNSYILTNEVEQPNPGTFTPSLKLVFPF